VVPFKVVGKVQRKYSKEQWEKRQEYRRRYAAENKDQQAEWQKKYREDNYLKYLLMECNTRAKQKGWEIEIDLAWIEQQYVSGVCSKTGIPYPQGNIDSPWKPSIDRINSTKGYTKNNCQLVCWAYNRAKSNMTEDAFIRMCKAVVNRETLNVFNERPLL
jgi:hypothetical protein